MLLKAVVELNDVIKIGKPELEYNCKRNWASALNQSPTMAIDRNYSRLAQMITLKPAVPVMIDNILKDGSINYQIPVNSIQDSKNKGLEGCTALHIVIQDLNVEAAQRLLQHGADFTIQNSTGETALHQAILKTYFSKATKNELNGIINLILKVHVLLDIFENPCDKNGLTHFHAACIVDHEAAVKFFIKKSTSLNKPISLDSPYAPGFTPLHLAARYGSIKTFKILLEEGADVTLRNADGLSPLHWLIQRNMAIAYWMEIEERLVQKNERTVFKKNEFMIRTVLKKHKNSKDGLLDDSRLSYFHVLCMLQNNTSEIEQYISSNVVDLQQSIKTKSTLWPGYTALHFASKFSIKTVKVLLKHGACVKARDAKNTMPLDLCMEIFRVEDLHSVVESRPDWKSVMLTDQKTSLLELLDAMRSENSLEIFTKKADVNVSIPIDSPLWPGCTPLHLAIALSKRVEVNEEHNLYLERIRILLKAGADVTLTDPRGTTPIHIAFSLRKYKAINLLLSTNRVIFDLVNEDNISHLQVACAAGNLDVVRTMLQATDVNVNLALKISRKFQRISEANLASATYYFTAGSTPLHIAVVTRNVAMTKLLVERGADIHAQDSRGFTPIHRLLGDYFCPNVAAMARILFAVEDLKDVTTRFGLSHLHVACWVNHKAAVEKLLDQGVDVNVCLSGGSEELLQSFAKYRSFRPMDFAYCRKRSNVMDLIFRRCERFLGDPRNVLNAARYTTDLSSFNAFKKAHGSSLEMWEEQYGISSLHVACYQYDVDAVEELLKQGADPNARVSSETVSWTGLTPLHLLVDNSYRVESKINAIARILIDYGADVTVENPEGATVVHQVMNAFGFKKKETLLLLLNGQKNFDVNPGSNSQRISHFLAACILNAASAVEKFLKHGIDVNQASDPMISLCGGYTPLQTAARFNAKETVELLLEHGADVHAQNCEGDTAFHCAALYKTKPTEERGICESLVMSLIDAGSKVNTTNIYGETSLEILLKTQKPTSDILRFLLKNQRCVNIFNDVYGTGFIATAIKRLTNIKHITENPVYRAVIDSPEDNGVNDHGQTPIHNIVSISKVAAPTKVYIKAIEGFLNLGIDIDLCNKKGETPLHLAVYYQNSKAIASLLTLGANINLLCNGQTPLSYHWKYCRISDVSKLLETDRQIIKLFAKQVYKWQLIDFHVAKMNKAVEAELQKRQWHVDLKAVEQCQVELERLETSKIGRSDISWWSLLSETGVIASFPTMRQVQRQALRDVFERHSFRLHKEFPEFAGILHMQYRKAVDRLSWIEPSKESLSWLFQFNLPDLCSDRILRYLENADLVHLIDST